METLIWVFITLCESCRLFISKMQNLKRYHFYVASRQCLSASSNIALEALAWKRWEALPPPADSPYMSPCDIHLFRPLKTALKNTDSTPMQQWPSGSMSEQSFFYCRWYITFSSNGMHVWMPMFSYENLISILAL